MFINKISSYIPDKVVPNSYFSEINGLDEEWILSRTGIQERRQASKDENSNTMAVRAIELTIHDLPFPKEEIDLIVGATYTPYDTIHSLAHAAQYYLDLSDIPVLSISTACSSFANSMEVVEGYFAMGKASKALVLVSDKNTDYSNEQDKKGGHLWGDGASAIFVSKERLHESDWEVKEIITAGAGNIGKAPDGVFLRPAHEGFVMGNGRDVFLNACQYMAKVTKDILEKNNYTLDDLSYFVPHQANFRITKNVAENLGLDISKALSNIQELGNTGCAGCSIALFQNQANFKKGDKIVVTVFGGGYSYGAMLIEV